MSKNNFRIIAIKILDGCDLNYLKILKLNTPYYFYNNFKIDKNENISWEEALPEGFYSANGTKINISAIVGKNGSGKSTIIEILFRIINNIAHKYSINPNQLKYTDGLKASLYFEADFFYKITVSDKQVKVFKYNRKGVLNKTPVSDFKIKDFFYTVAVNYSHYAYNPIEYDDKVNWLESLFHKNDGYQIPLVINPMRKDGNIEINNENHLVTARLITNLLTPNEGSINFKKIAPKIKVVSLNLVLNESRRTSPLYANDYKDKHKISGKEVTLNDLDIDEDYVFKRLNKHYNFNYNSNDIVKYKLVFDYILYKLVSIAIKYVDYNKYFDKELMCFDKDYLDEYFSVLIDDDSHIVFKLMQTLNFLKFEHIPFESNTFELGELTRRVEKVLSKRLTRKIKRIELIPPPIFNVEINVKSDAENSEIFSLSKLSSGEKQLVYSVSSILYHLVNLNSISNTKNRISYKYINIVLEEIELYFHPEMQRSYIDHIVNSIESISLKKIKAINICFVTHSPFVLSDIPKSNVLFLNETGQPVSQSEESQTFGGNVIDLLSKSFFLDNGYIGEFAKNKIQKIIMSLQKDSEEISSVSEKELLLNSINLIGEPFLKDKLTEMYYLKYDKQERIKILEDELKELKNDTSEN